MVDTVVITGAGTPLGRAIADRFVSRDAHVVLGGRDRDEVLAVADDLEAGGGEATGVRADERDEFDLERLAETASRAGGAGGIDVVVPAASVRHDDPGESPLQETSYSAYDDTMRSNGRGVYATIKESVPHLTSGASVVVPIDDTASLVSKGVGPVGEAARIALVGGFAADLEQPVGATLAGEAVGGDVADAADLVAWAADLAPDVLDGAILGPDDRS